MAQGIEFALAYTDYKIGREYGSRGKMESAAMEGESGPGILRKVVPNEFL